MMIETNVKLKFYFMLSIIFHRLSLSESIHMKFALQNDTKVLPEFSDLEFS